MGVGGEVFTFRIRVDSHSRTKKNPSRIVVVQSLGLEDSDQKGRMRCISLRVLLLL